jgi:hypothetical protein
MPGNYFVNLPAYRDPGGLDFSGLNSAIKDWGAANERNAMRAYQQSRDKKADARADEAMDMRRKTFSAEEHTRRSKVMGGVAQSLLDAKTPQEQSSMLTALQQLDPEFSSDLQKHGYDVNNVEQWAPAVISMARGFENPADRAKADADLKLTMARAKYYEGGGRSVGGGGRQAVIDRLREEDPDLSYAEALALAQRAPRDDRLGRDRLAVDAAKNALDPEEVDQWRGRFGGTRAGPPPAPQPDVNRFNFGGAQRQGSRESPLTPKSQADIDRAPSGTHFLVNGKLMVKP